MHKCSLYTFKDIKRGLLDSLEPDDGKRGTDSRAFGSVTRAVKHQVISPAPPNNSLMPETLLGIPALPPRYISQEIVTIYEKGCDLKIGEDGS